MTYMQIWYLYTLQRFWSTEDQARPTVLIIRYQCLILLTLMTETWESLTCLPCLTRTLPSPRHLVFPSLRTANWASPPSTTFQLPPSGKFMTDHTFRVLHSTSPSFHLFGYSPYPHSPCSLPIWSPQHVAYDFVFYLVFKGCSSRQEDHCGSSHSECAMPSPSIPPPAHTPSFQPHKSIYSHDI